MRKSVLFVLLIIVILTTSVFTLSGCGNKKEKSENQSESSNNKNYENLEWNLKNPVYFNDYTHSVVNAISGYKTPMKLQFTASGTFSFEIINKDLYEKNNNEESIKELVAGVCAVFLNDITSRETFNSDKNFKEQINKSDLLEYVNIHTGNVGIKVTEITLDKFELTDDSIAKIKEYNKKMNK